jgi:aminoglycoside 3-N-acetyltransferase
MLKPLQRLKAPLRAWWQRRQQAARVAELAQTAPRASTTSLLAELRALGIESGDALFIHSSLKSLGFVEGGAPAVVAALQQAVGEQGTLLVPTYWQPGGTILGTCQMPGYRFDVRSAATNMGALPAAFLATPGVQRSVHPTHSCAAWGAMATHLTEAHHLAPSVFGPGSPWERFAKVPQAKVLGLGVSMGPVTWYHLIEDELGDAFPLPLWLEPPFSIPCVDAQGREHTVPVRAFKPQWMQQRIDHPSRDDLRRYFAAEFNARGLRASGLVGAGESWWIGAAGFAQHLRALVREGIHIYATPEQLAARPVR